MSDKPTPKQLERARRIGEKLADIISADDGMEQIVLVARYSDGEQSTISWVSRAGDSLLPMLRQAAESEQDRERGDQGVTLQ